MKQGLDRFRARERKYETNKGRICKAPDCNFTAKVKGYCNHCYVKYQRSRMTYKKAGVDVEKEEQAIKEILSSIKSQDSRKNTGHYAGLISLENIR